MKPHQLNGCGGRSLGVALFLLGMVRLGSAGLFDEWEYRAKITFPEVNPAAPLTNFPALIILGTNMTGFEAAQFGSPQGADLRFADSNETTALNYEIEDFNSNGTVSAWVQLPHLAGTNDFIYAYWGRTSVTASA